MSKIQRDLTVTLKNVYSMLAHPDSPEKEVVASHRLNHE